MANRAPKNQRPDRKSRQINEWPPSSRTPPTTINWRFDLDPDRKIPRRGSIRANLRGEVMVQEGLKIGEKEK